MKQFGTYHCHLCFKEINLRKSGCIYLQFCKGCLAIIEQQGIKEQQAIKEEHQQREEEEFYLNLNKEILIKIERDHK